MELFGLIVFSALFISSGLNHVLKHKDIAGYAATAFGNCPIKDQLGYLGGWPTGLFLLAVGIGTIVNESNVFAYAIAAFLALTGALFHRNLKDPATLKHYSLLGAALYIASQVS